MGFGFVVARFGLIVQELSQLESNHPRSAAGVSVWLGTGLLVIGIGVNVIAAAQHTTFIRRLNRGEPYVPPRWSLGVALAAILAAIGIAMIVYLLMIVP